MAERARISLPFGAGLDRATGVMEVEPASFRDLRNVVLFNGKAQARRGFGSAGTLVNIALAAMTALYLGLAQQVKRWFYARHPITAPGFPGRS